MNLRLSAARLHEAMERSGGAYYHVRNTIRWLMMIAALGYLLWHRYISLR
jgi:hypothetical protein